MYHRLVVLPSFKEDLLLPPSHKSVLHVVAQIVVLRLSVLQRRSIVTDMFNSIGDIMSQICFAC
ncbi:hypothetical protein Csa_012080 [Cucumis sativus]|uniref:Uncharacterized protein n=1 Tax=Cucumis sativus TaxID=3659 RepID=A0A0A0KYC8_CUCSA|nr:hypothetical protein Csa_012080 [Cucumis sativus]